ncbi:MAG: nucleoside triphosphate pyrophosphohydrolase [Nitrospinae bacterium]|nr:nucleoside triphosphate pyrophosphohydrolase [Nitrospinota bacterium]
MSEAFDRLVGVMARLRSPGGCPWDAEQTHESLKPYLLEETYEVLEAIDGGSMPTLRDELGDLILQVVFHAQLAHERGDFTAADVCHAISDKLIRRHPHVFGAAHAPTPGAVVTQWEKIKKTEEGHKERTSALDGVPAAMPSLARAYKIGKKAARAGFDWANVDGAFEKVEEELAEFRAAFAERDVKHMEEELGDLLFSLVNVARFMEVNPEEALRKTIGKFIRRFAHVEARIEASGKELGEATLAEMDALWDEAKKNE